MIKYLQEEARRCLKCINPRCTKACPISTPIPEVVGLFEEEKLHEAGVLLFKNNPLSAICAIVCPHEDQCKGSCVRAVKGMPVNFPEIEKYISERFLKELEIEKRLDNHRRIAVVGSGPAGITAAILLAQKGYCVTMFELRDRIGGVLTYGIPEFRLPRTIVEDLRAKLVQLGVKLKPNTTVGPVITLDKLLTDGYDAVFIGTGVWNPKTLNIKGETLGHSLFAIDYLKNPSAYQLGKRVCVIGAGNVAMDAARTARYYGSSDVQIFYRRGAEYMTATRLEIEAAEKEGVVFNPYKSPVEITEEGVVFASTKMTILEDGSSSVLAIPNTEDLFPCDNIIIAVSQLPKSNIVSTSPDLQTKHGLIVADMQGCTSKKGVFACGDVVSGARTVVDAVVAAKIVANSIDEYCKAL